jgi:predicted kinase
MLYVVGGCSRSGKSTLAERMRARHGVPWFPLDALKMGLHLGAPSYGVHPDEDDLETADCMWPIVKGVLEHLIFDGRDYLIEGVNLRPQTVAKFVEQADEPVRTCFLGYPDVGIEAKAAQVARYAGLPNDWLHRTGPDNVRRYLEVSRSLSRRLREDCATLGIPFFDMGADFHAGVESAERALMVSTKGLPPLG